MFTLKSEPQDKYELLKQGLALYRLTFRLTFPYSLAGAILIFSPLLFLGIVHKEAAAHHMTWLMAGSTVGSVIFLGALIFHLYCFSYRIHTTFLQSIRQILLRLIPLILLGALYAIIILGGTMLLIIPGIFLTYSLLFSFMLLITGNQGVLQTLITSHRLVQGNWWRTFWMMTFPLLLAIAVSIAVFVIVAALVMKFEIADFAIPLIIFFANSVVQACIIPLMFSIALVTLHDLRQRYYKKIPPW